MVKIGLTTDTVESRIKQLNSATGVPLPFECHFAAGHGADVAMVFLAARLKTTHIFTIDRADFDTYRTQSGKPFNRLWVKV